MNYGFIKVAAATPTVKVADCNYNIQEMIPLIKEAGNKQVEIMVFPELGITAYTCGILFRQQLLTEAAENALSKLLEESASVETVIIVGLPIAINGTLLNCAATIHRGKIKGLIKKEDTIAENKPPHENIFATARNTSQCERITLCGQEVEINNRTLFKTPGCTFGITIGEDPATPYPASIRSALQGAEIIFNLTAENEEAGKYEERKQACLLHSKRCRAGYVCAGCGFGESSTDLVFSGYAMIAENGKLLQESRRFSLAGQMIISEIDVEKIRHRRQTYNIPAENPTAEHPVIKIIPQKSPNSIDLTRNFEQHPFIPSKTEECNNRCREIFNIQALGLAKRIIHTNTDSCIIGISGGLDSTLALLVTAHAFDMLNKSHSDIIGITMPGFGTTDRTYNNALALMKELGVTTREISIKDACVQHFKDIQHNITNHDVTYENAQARERTQILMDVANQTGGMVIGTGDLSELALGWATYNGDHMSMYGVNASVPKTLVQHLVRWVAENIVNTETRNILLDIADTPISPELLPADNSGNIEQKTEDLVGPYELHDFFLYHFIKEGYSPKKIYFIAQRTFKGIYNDETIKKWLTTFFRRFFTQQFKRSCIPDGPKVGSCNLSPRGDWRMPSDASYSLWITECNGL